MPRYHIQLQILQARMWIRIGKKTIRQLRRPDKSKSYEDEEDKITPNVIPVKDRALLLQTTRTSRFRFPESDPGDRTGPVKNGPSTL